MTKTVLWTLSVLLLVSIKMGTAEGIIESTVSSGEFLCRVSGKRQVTCLQGRDGGPTTQLLTLTTSFEPTPATTQMKIFKESLFLTRNIHLIVQPLTQGGVKRTITLAHPIYSFSEGQSGVLILYRYGDQATVQWVSQDPQTGQWDFNSQPTAFQGSATLFSDATSDVATFTSTWGDLYVVYSTEDSTAPVLRFTGVWNGIVHSSPAPLLRGCSGNTKIVNSPQNSLLLIHCKERLFAYNYNEASWADMQGIDDLKFSSLFFHPKGKFLAGLLNSKSNMKPSQLVFFNFQWQTAYVSLRKSSLSAGLFTQEGDRFCFTEKRVPNLTCYNVSLLLSEQEFEGPTMQTYSLPPQPSTLVGSVQDKVIVEYSSSEEPERVVYASLPKLKTFVPATVEIDRAAVCEEMKSALPTLARVFC